jgi:hypothetical protein
MKKYFFKVLSFFLLIGVTCVIIEIMIRHIPNDYKFKCEYLDNKADSIKVLFLGASDCQSGLNPTYLGKKSFNAGHPGQSIDYSYALLKKYKKNWSNLNYIVLVVSYPGLFYKMEKSVEAWRTKNYTIYYKIAISKRLKYHFEIANGRLFDHVLRLSDYYLKNRDEILCDDQGWEITSNKETPKDSLIITGIRAAKRHTVTKDKECFLEMKNTLDSIIDFTKRKKCRIILCTPPAYNSYRENVNIYQYKKTFKAYIDFEKNNHNCTYLNLFNDSRFTDRDFLDGDHLNANGAKKLTLIIDSVINSQTLSYLNYK